MSPPTTELLLLLASLLLLGGAIAACMLLHRLGVATTYLRDLLHVGAGVWVLGWPLWPRPLPPIAVACGAFVATALVPRLQRRSSLARRIHDAFAAGDERWGGLVLYTAAFAAGTIAFTRGHAVAAAAALWALTLGDGLGGAIGRRFGAHRFTVPGGKSKSLEGSLGVALFAGLGALAAGRYFAAPQGGGLILAVAAVAALAEALAPRGTDNLLVPAAVGALVAVVQEIERWPS